MQVKEARGECPYCGEPLQLLVDPSELGQVYIEDCEVCCRPIQIYSEMDEAGQCQVRLFHENEVPGT